MPFQESTLVSTNMNNFVQQRMEIVSPLPEVSGYLISS